MENILEKLPEKIKSHLKNLIEISGLPDTEESLNLIARNWADKKDMFESQIKNLNMEEIPSLSENDGRAALLLTYSGSLIGLGPDKGDGRWMEYASIKMRNDVPEIVLTEKTKTQGGVETDKSAHFSDGPVKSTSSLFKIAVCSGSVDVNEQEKRIKEAMIFLTNGFIKLNRQSLPADGAPEQFNMKSMAGYVAGKNGITQKLAKNILEDFIALIETGMLLNERVALGRIGILSMKLKEAQKPRVIRNPKTGTEMTVEAKPETFVPKMVFSRYMKTRAGGIKTD